MNPEHCLINLSRLKGAELKTGYSTKGIRHLFGRLEVALSLPFTRSQFIQELPERQKGMSTHIWRKTSMRQCASCNV